MERDTGAIGDLETEIEGLKERLAAVEKELETYKAAEAKRLRKE